MQKVIVFGGNGLVGTSLIKKLKDSSFDTIAPSSKEVDMNDREALADFAKLVSVDAEEPVIIVFIAATVPYRTAVHDDYGKMIINANMAYNVKYAFSNVNVAEIIYISTLDVYKKTNDVLTEDSPLGPTSNYGIFKLAAEMILKSFTEKKGMPLCCLRLSNVYGINDDSPKVINKFLESALATNTINITGDKNVLRDFIYDADVASVISSFIGKGVNTTVNVATGKPVSLSFLAQCVADNFSSDIAINNIDPATKGNNVQFDITRLRKYYKGEFTPIEKMIPQLLEKKKR